MRTGYWHRINKYRHKIKSVAIVFFALTLLWYFADFQLSRRPATNTDAYRALHGVYREQANDLRIGGVLFHFPASYEPEPYSSSDDMREIFKGKAESVDVIVNMTSGHAMPPGDGGKGIRVRISTGGYEDDKKVEEYFRERRWASIKDLPELGLKEYVKSGAAGGWGYATYESLDPKIKTPRGGRFTFNCTETSIDDTGECRTYYQHAAGPIIEYYFPNRLLPHWKDLHTEVIVFIDSLIVRE